ncbi:MAG TPA: type 1 glutamine amidotransferase domain-containing protein [Candidatus Dormibacteraeota bacterium]|nr:type 1 glutamine amidotransferase domain-containing protein [Candidatus Dormibacteraeota bacterium]
MKIACVIGPRFEDSEFKEPYDAFRAAGHEVTTVGLEAGAELEGDKGKIKIKPEKSFRDVKPDDFQALFIPGGSSPDKLRAHPEAVQFVKAFMKAGKPVFAICHGPQLLLAADEYRGHRMTAWKTIQDDLRKAGANVVDQEVMVDRNLVTSRQPSDIPAFVRESLKVLEQVPAIR